VLGDTNFILSMKAQKFKAVVDDRDRVTIPIANIKVLNKTIQKEKRDWPNSIIEIEIKSIRFVDGKKIDFDTII